MSYCIRFAMKALVLAALACPFAGCEVDVNEGPVEEAAEELDGEGVEADLDVDDGID